MGIFLVRVFSFPVLFFFLSVLGILREFVNNIIFIVIITIVSFIPGVYGVTSFFSFFTFSFLSKKCGRNGKLKITHYFSFWDFWNFSNYFFSSFPGPVFWLVGLCGGRDGGRRKRSSSGTRSTRPGRKERGAEGGGLKSRKKGRKDKTGQRDWA